MHKLAEAAEQSRDLILEAHAFVWAHPETGYKETQTSAYLEAAFAKLGYSIDKPGDIPGFVCEADTGRPGPTLLVLGELDALVCRAHPDASRETGAAHCCGHSAQCAALLGVAAALKQPGALDGLCGKIRLCAVPAEELIELDYRAALRAAGKIHFYCGKSEFLYRGYFDGVDLALLVHTTQGNTAAVQNGCNGCIAKRVVYKGRAAHAGGAPWDGCNALYAATLGLSAVNALRETFRERDTVRVHPILTKGGSAVNAIPEEAVLESFVRGGSFAAIERENIKINRALCGGALAMGANAEILDSAGYAPLQNDATLRRVCAQAAEEIGLSFVLDNGISTGSTDLGDLSMLMPVVQPYCPGAVGTSHGEDYRIEDPYTACVISAKWQAQMLALLLGDGASCAQKIVNDYVPRFASKRAYIEYMQHLFTAGERICYREDGSAEVRGR